MKRKLLFFVLSMTVCLAALFMFACDTPVETTQSDNLSEITGITFSDYSYDYDATEKTILIQGDLPDGVTVEYTNNSATNSGTYNATATLSGEGYKTKTLRATLTINKLYYDTSAATWSYSDSFDYDGSEKSVGLTGLPEGVTVSSYIGNVATDAGTYSATAVFSYDTVNHHAPIIDACNWVINKANFSTTISAVQSVLFDGEFHLPEHTGAIPEGTDVSYFINDAVTTGVCAIGNYAVKVLLSNKNYNDLELDCTFKITVNATKIAAAIVKAFGTVPEPWSFLPESFSTANHTLASAISYEDFVNVSSIPVNGIGKQLNVVYGVLNNATVALGYVNKVYQVLNAFETAYTTFLDNDPDNYYKSFEFNKGIVSLSYQTVGTEYVINASVSGISLTIFSDANGSGYGAKIVLSDSNVFKYTVSENQLTVALHLLGHSATYIDFVRNDSGEVTGYIHEALSAANKEITLASALLKVGETYTTVVGTKGDFIVPAYGNNRNCEVYQNSTGRLVGAEVRETLKPNSTTEYSTLWYNLYSITGISSIKKIDEKNGSNADTIYINGNTDTIHTKLVGGVSLKSASRRFDIEFKTMYFYTINANKEYEQITCEIPMMFIQEEQVSTFETDFNDKNGVAVSLNVSTNVKSAVNYGFHTLVVAYDKIRNTISYEDIVSYCNS